MSRRQGDEVHIEEEDAAGGSKEGVVRWVLLISTLGAIILLSIIWITGALWEGDTEEEITQTGMIQDVQDGESTDGVVIDEADELETEIGAAEADMDALAEDAGSGEAPESVPE